MQRVLQQRRRLHSPTSMAVWTTGLSDSGERNHRGPRSALRLHARPVCLGLLLRQSTEICVENGHRRTVSCKTLLLITFGYRFAHAQSNLAETTLFVAMRIDSALFLK